MRQRRPGISMFSLLVIIAILGILIGLLLPAVQKVREAANQARCMNNMRQIALAFHNYASFYNDELPADYDQFVNKVGPPPTFKKTSRTDFPKAQPFYIPLLPFIEQEALFRKLGADKDAKMPPVMIYQCPTRSARLKAGKPLDDYGSGQHPHFFTAGKYAGVDWKPQPKEWKNAYAVLGGIVHKKITFQMITKGDGASNTFLFAHKGVEPRFYNGNGPDDEGWAHVGNYWEHKRFPGYFGPDSNNAQGGGGPGNLIMTSPHQSVMPTAFCDGSVRMVNFGVEPKTLGLLWAYNDGQKVEAP